MFDHLGQIKPGGLGEEGLYHEGTRYLSCLILELDGRPPFFLGSTVRDENDQLSVALTNPDRIRDGRVEVPLGTLHLAVRTFLWQGACHWQARAQEPWHWSRSTASIQLRFRADFADIFEVRGNEARGPGPRPAPEMSAGPGDARVRRPRRDRRADAAPLHAGPGASWLRGPGAVRAVAPSPGGGRARAGGRLLAAARRRRAPGFDDAQAAAAAALERFKTGSCRVARVRRPVRRLAPAIRVRPAHADLRPADRAVSVRRAFPGSTRRSAATGSSPPSSASGSGPSWPEGSSRIWRPRRRPR